MKARTALMVAILFLAGPALAQAPATPTKPKPAAQHQPGIPAPPVHPAAQKPAAPTSSAAPANPADEKVDPEKEAAIVQLMQLTQESKLGDGVSEFVTSQVRSAISRTLPAERLPKFMDTFSQKFAASHVPGSVNDAMVHIYARNFSTEDIHGLIRFYESPVGQHAMKALPDVERDSQAAGLEIGRSAAIGILNGMSDEYPELKAMLHPPAPEPGPNVKPAQTPAAPSEAPAPAPKPAPEASTAPKQPAPTPQQ